RKFHALEILDADGTSIPVITAADDARSKQFSQELRLTWNDGGPVTAFVGANYFHEEGSDRTPAQFDERAALAQIAGALNGGGLIPGRPASDPAPMSVLGNPLLLTACSRASLARSVTCFRRRGHVPVRRPSRAASRPI